MTEEGEGTGLEETPTYAVAIVAFAFILVSLVVERAIHRLKKYLKKKHQKPLRKVLDKLTEELMLLGFISLLITVLQNPLIKICVTPNFSRHMLPCSHKDYEEADAPTAESHVSIVGRKLLNCYLSAGQGDTVGPKRQLLQEAIDPEGHCGRKGKVPFVSLEVLHQLHLFIFTLAITHVLYSLVTVLLGFARLHNWAKWEVDTRQDGYDGNLDLERRYCKKVQCKRVPLVGLAGHANAFVDRHANHPCYENPFSLWILCFFQQFVVSVSREDYLIFRVGFLNKHGLGESFNFRDYVIRSMEVDFKRVIGISWWLWLFVILFLLLNVHGWYTYFWAAFVPTVIVLVIGTKQQHIISTLALQAKRHAAEILASEAEDARISKSRKVIDISAAVSPSDNLFWFDDPKFLLKLLHFVIFQNSFELAIFFWLVTAFGWKSCILGNHTLLIVRLITGLMTQLLASYSTLPIYALVTQMGSTMKQTVFTKDVFEGLVGWREKAKRNRDKRTSAANSLENSLVGENESSRGAASNEGSETLHPSTELPSIPREGKLDQCPIHDHGGPNESLTRTCQLMYGKERGLELLKAAASKREQR